MSQERAAHRGRRRAQVPHRVRGEVRVHPGTVLYCTVLYCTVLYTQAGYVTDQKCSKWPKEVCSIAKELRSKANPVTKCEMVKNSVISLKWEWRLRKKIHLDLEPYYTK